METLERGLGIPLFQSHGFTAFSPLLEHDYYGPCSKGPLDMHTYSIAPVYGENRNLILQGLKSQLISILPKTLFHLSD